MLHLDKIIRSNAAQGTVEFAIVTAAILIIILALGGFWHLGKDGIFIQHALSSASHNVEEGAGGIVGDVFSC